MLGGANLKGNVAEAAVVFEAARHGIPVLLPAAEHGRYDIGLELGGELRRVQCKWATLKDDVVVVRLVTSRRGRDGFLRTTYAKSEIDFVAAYCEEIGRVFLLPSRLIDGMSAIQLRLAPTKNGQRASIHFADQYEFGAVAQLEERRHGMAEARGSSPLSSIPSIEISVLEVGAHEFRNQFGYFMEQAAGGTEILVRRRGKPYVRIAGVQPQLKAAD